MSFRKRIQGTREERAKARSERRQEALRAERAKRIAKAERVEKATPDPGPSERRVTTRPRSGKTAFGEGPTGPRRAAGEARRSPGARLRALAGQGREARDPAPARRARRRAQAR